MIDAHAPFPPSLSPFFTSHPASSAYWITCSPHEWTWTQAQQEAMAEAVVRLDSERARLRAALKEARDSRPSQKWQADIIDAALAVDCGVKVKDSQ